jgi:hypothetical protein
MPSAVAVAKKAVNSSVVSKVFRLQEHGRDEVLVVFDVDVHDVMVPVGPSGVEILFQRGVGAVAGNGEEHVVDAIGAQRLQADLVAQAAPQFVVGRGVALQQAVGDEQQGIGRATAIVAVKHLAGARDRGLAEYLIALGFAFQEPKLFAGRIVSGADEVVTAHGHVAAVLVAEAAHGDAKADFFLDQFGRENFAEIAGSTLGRLRHCGLLRISLATSYPSRFTSSAMRSSRS